MTPSDPPILPVDPDDPNAPIPPRGPRPAPKRRRRSLPTPMATAIIVLAGVIAALLLG
jgi:hypothetical protein